MTYSIGVAALSGPTSLVTPAQHDSAQCQSAPPHVHHLPAKTHDAHTLNLRYWATNVQYSLQQPLSWYFASLHALVRTVEFCSDAQCIEFEGYHRYHTSLILHPHLGGCCDFRSHEQMVLEKHRDKVQMLLFSTGLTAQERLLRHRCCNRQSLQIRVCLLSYRQVTKTLRRDCCNLTQNFDTC